ncbi:hypothetical protein FNJ87_09920, partial [Nonlabens mediterrranea]|nr:hypothetical protein [Nonlabens mediterrranea]
MKQLLLLLLIILSACKDTTETITIVDDDKSEAQINSEKTKLPIDKVFPQDFLGAYKGELNITTSRGKESIPMEFH